MIKAYIMYSCKKSALNIHNTFEKLYDFVLHCYTYLWAEHYSLNLKSLTETKFCKHTNIYIRYLHSYPIFFYDFLSIFIMIQIQNIIGNIQLKC